MKKVAIVGVEGSGKTVMLAGLGELYARPDENGFFLAPKDYVVNPDVPIDVPVIAETGGSGSGGGCELGLGFAAFAALFILRKLERR